MNLFLLNSVKRSCSLHFPHMMEVPVYEVSQGRDDSNFEIKRKIIGNFSKLRNYLTLFSQSRKRDRNNTDFKKHRKPNCLKRSKSELVKLTLPTSNVPFLEQYFLKSFVHTPRWFHYSLHLPIPPAHLQYCTDTNTLLLDLNKIHWVTDTHLFRQILLCNWQREEKSLLLKGNQQQQMRWISIKWQSVCHIKKLIHNHSFLVAGFCNASLELCKKNISATKGWRRKPRSCRCNPWKWLHFRNIKIDQAEVSFYFSSLNVVHTIASSQLHSAWNMRCLTFLIPSSSSPSLLSAVLLCFFDIQQKVSLF